MTGATNGIGAHTVKIIATQPNTQVIVGARGTGQEVPEGVETYPLDLASLESVRAFADTVEQSLKGQQINMLVLNAGAQYPKLTYSDDGYEATFAINHLAHYLLARRLVPHIAASGRLVITTSSTHDPANFNRRSKHMKQTLSVATGYLPPGEAGGPRE